MMLQARLLRLPSQGQPGTVCTTGMPPPKPRPLPRPVVTTAALPQPVKAAHPAAAANLGKLPQPKITHYGPTPPAWQMSSAQRGASGQQGGQNATKQALLQPSAIAHIQLGSSANPAEPKTFQGGERSEGAQGHVQRKVASSGLAQSGPQAGAGQPIREHAASAAPAQAASTQAKGSEQSSSAAAAAAALAPQCLSREFAILCTSCSSVSGPVQLAVWLAMRCVSRVVLLLQLRAGTTAGLSSLTCAFKHK